MLTLYDYVEYGIRSSNIYFFNITFYRFDKIVSVNDATTVFNEMKKALKGILFNLTLLVHCTVHYDS